MGKKAKKAAPSLPQNEDDTLFEKIDWSQVGKQAPEKISVNVKAELSQALVAAAALAPAGAEMIGAEELQKLRDVADIQSMEFARATGEVTEPELNDEEGLRKATRRLTYRVPKGLQRVPWIDTLAVVGGKAADQGVKVNASVQRETMFHDLTLINCQEACRRMQVMGIAFTRPHDYMAEMLKTDTQMFLIRKKIADQQSRIRTVELRRERDKQKKFHTTLHRQRAIEKKAATNQAMVELDRWKSERRKAKGTDGSAEASFDKFTKSMSAPTKTTPSKRKKATSAMDAIAQKAVPRDKKPRNRN